MEFFTGIRRHGQGAIAALFVKGDKMQNTMEYNYYFMEQMVVMLVDHNDVNLTIFRKVLKKKGCITCLRAWKFKNYSWSLIITLSAIDNEEHVNNGFIPRASHKFMVRKVKQ